MTRILILISALLPLSLPAAVEMLQVEGMMLGFYPGLADGIHVVKTEDKRELKFTPGRRCLEVVRAERQGLAFNGISFEPEQRFTVRNKLTGLIGYPGVSPGGLKEDWLPSAGGLAAGFYRDNLASEPPENVTQLLFVPMVLSPKPMQVLRTEFTPEAKEVLAKEGWPGLEKFCGSHFVEALGEENYVVYSIRIAFSDRETRVRVENARLDSHKESPGLVLNNLYRMGQRFEIAQPGTVITLDVLQVGGRPADVEVLTGEIAHPGTSLRTERAADSLVTRATVTCTPEKIGPCQRLAQTFLDFQFQRLNFNGERPSFAPVRFRIAPLKYLNTLNY